MGEPTRLPEGTGLSPQSVHTYVQYRNKEISNENLVEKALQGWKACGHSMKDVTSLDVYAKPEEGKAYYVINKSVTGNFLLFD